MTDRTEKQIREIRRRTQQKRCRLENRLLSGLTVSCLFLITGICMILEHVKVPGVSTVTYGYSTVLLQEGTSAYVVTAIVAFCVGVGVTILCIRYRNRQERLENHNEKRTETLLK